jgi:hypothetical protein
MSMSQEEDAFAGPEQVQIDVAGARLTVTRADVQAMKAALLAHLRQSDAEDRDLLVRMTERAPAWIDAEGAVRVGAWLLQPRESGLALTYRLPPGRDAGKAYAALLSRADGQWTVQKLLTERIRVAR